MTKKELKILKKTEMNVILLSEKEVKRIELEILGSRDTALHKDNTSLFIFAEGQKSVIDWLLCKFKEETKG